jgi:nitrate reductase gamma subunit
MLAILLALLVVGIISTIISEGNSFRILARWEWEQAITSDPADASELSDKPNALKYANVEI